MRTAWLAAVVILIGYPLTARAADSLRLSPALQDVVLSEPGETRTLALTLTNSTASDLTVVLSTTDFGQLNETGGLAFIGDDDQSWQHRLAAWLTVDRDRVTVPAGQSVTATLRLVNRDDLTPGGHYAAVLARIVDAADTSATAASSQIGWQGVLATQLYVLKRGGETYQLSLLDIEPSGTVWRQPGAVSLRWRVDGNTHIKPYGQVEVLSGRGQVVASGTINEDSAIILPGATRVMAVKLTGARWWPGHYMVRVRYHRQDSADWLEASQTFWYFPVWFIVALVGLLILIVGRMRRA